MRFLYQLILIYLLFSCTSQPTFVLQPAFIKVNESDRDGYVSTLWRDSTSQIMLNFRGADLGGMGHTSWFSIEKASESGDTITYRISGDYHHLASKVYNDTLYLYKNYPNSPGIYQGWYEFTTTSMHKLNELEKKPLDSTQTQQLYGAIYRWEGNKLVKYANNTIQFHDLRKQEGLYFIPPPGIGIRYKCNLKGLNEQLFLAK
jgi:hypothetical protein